MMEGYTGTILWLDSGMHNLPSRDPRYDYAPLVEESGSLGRMRRGQHRISLGLAAIAPARFQQLPSE